MLSPPIYTANKPVKSDKSQARLATLVDEEEQLGGQGQGNSTAGGGSAAGGTSSALSGDHHVVQFMTQKEAIAHIEENHRSLKYAWMNGERVQTLKIAIQVGNGQRQDRYIKDEGREERQGLSRERKNTRRGR